MMYLMTAMSKEQYIKTCRTIKLHVIRLERYSKQITRQVYYYFETKLIIDLRGQLLKKLQPAYHLGPFQSLAQHDRRRQNRNTHSVIFCRFLSTFYLNILSP